MRYNGSTMNDIIKLKPVIWENTNKISSSKGLFNFTLSYKDIEDAEARLLRFAPLIKLLFPEVDDGIIESPLREIPTFKKKVEDVYNTTIGGRLFLKCDSHLNIAGSIKARGGIYEVLHYSEKLAVENGMISYADDYSKLISKECKSLFSRHRILVASSGNLGLSVGIMSKALGFEVTVHMSRDAKEWKKDLLRKRGAIIIEHQGDFSKAVEEARAQSYREVHSYFVDDENSKYLFLGYSVAALRLVNQLKQKNIEINKENPLYVYLPCGVGGSPGGITFGLKHLFGDNVHCHLIEPTHACSMLLGLLTGKYNDTHVNDYGIDNITEADGLAVGRASKFVSPLLDKLIDGIVTFDDNDLYILLYLLKNTENVKIEPSAASSLIPPIRLSDTNKNAIHICWATGGLMVPDAIYDDMYHKGEALYHDLA